LIFGGFKRILLIDPKVFSTLSPSSEGEGYFCGVEMKIECKNF